MIIRPFQEQKDDIDIMIGSKDQKSRRDIYIKIVPNVDVDNEWGETFSTFSEITIVNRSVYKGAPLFISYPDSYDWTYLKSVYVFSARIPHNCDPINSFQNLTLYPQRVLTTGYTSKAMILTELGMSIVDLDGYRYGHSLFKELSPYNRLKVIDPRFYSDRDHLIKFGRYPDDYLLNEFYKGSDFIDQNTRFYKGVEPIGHNFIADSGNTTDVVSLIDQNQIMRWRSVVLHNATVDLFYPPAVASIDSLIAMYDTEKGMKIEKLQVPSFLPKRIAMEKAQDFVDNLKRVGDNISSNIGNIRLFYYTSDYQDRLKVFYHNDDNNAHRDYTILNMTRSDILDDILVSTSDIR